MKFGVKMENTLEHIQKKTKLDGLDAKQQEKTQSIDEEKDLELDEFEK